MATTKIIPGVLDLNEANSESGLKMPKGNSTYAAPPAVAEGMMRNEVGQDSNNSASCMQHYNGVEWKNFVNVPLEITVDYLVVAGGGSGGDGDLAGSGGGGGAGGLRTSYTGAPNAGSGGGQAAETAITVTAGTAYTVEVGDGGAGTSGLVPGNDGADSKFGVVGSEIVSTGGGGGAYANQAGRDGGSGGGGGNSAAAGGTDNYGNAVTSPTIQGFRGGKGFHTSPFYPDGGGGGAGAAGGDATSGSSQAGNGGAGLEVNIIGGSGNFYAGGGAFGRYNSSSGGTGGTGGGGGYGGGQSIDGTAYTGGGGAGVSAQSTSGAGGKGVVILRYPTASVSSFSVTGTLNTPTAVVDGSDSSIIFTTGTGTITFS